MPEYPIQEIKGSGNNRHLIRAILLSIGVAACIVPAHARVTRISVDSVTPLRTADDKLYEVVVGTFFGEVDPDDPHNELITDIDLTPRNADGKVVYQATFRIARPRDPQEGSGGLIFDVPNRGMIISGLMRAPETLDSGGHVWVASGWQGDLQSGGKSQTVTVPIAKRMTGKPIVGPVLVRLIKVKSGVRSAPLTAGIVVPVARPLPSTLDTSKAQLWRENKSGTKTPVPSSHWAFADCGSESFPGRPDPSMLCLKDGFDPDSAYTLVYEGMDPPVLGIGFAATRDFVAYLRSGRPDDAGNPNPAGPGIRWTLGRGYSQSGNFLKSFVNLGFNSDESGARVFDGINPHIAARQVPLNIRFGVPGGAASPYEPGSEGTLWWGRYNDKRRHRGISSLLDRCTASNTCPKIIETFGSAEFWGLRYSPNLVGTDARADIALPPNVRRYYFPSTGHGGSFGTGFVPEGDPKRLACVLPANPNVQEPTMRAVQQMLIAWVASDKEPPPSSYPAIATGDLVEPTAKAMGWNSIPGAPGPDGKINKLPNNDLGPSFQYNDLSGVITRQPPRAGQTIPLLVPRVNVDGNEVSGIPSVQLLVPLGTYLGWNVEAAGIDQGKGCGFEAGFIPFARNKAQRIASGDRRLSLEERYGDHAGFVARVREEVDRQVKAGWLLRTDGAQIISDAEASSVLR